MIKETVEVIQEFRQTALGKIRLKKLAYPCADKMKITIGEKEVFPIGFDSYGHPIISEGAFKYYKVMKAKAKKEGKDFSIVVEYEERPFCIRRSAYDSEDRKMLEFETVKPSIESANLKDLKGLKEILVHRKMAVFLNENLNRFLLYDKYLLGKDGKVYEYPSKEKHNENIVKFDGQVDTTILKETHIPGEHDFCAICGKPFNICDVKQFEVTEDENCNKVHRKCQEEYEELETEIS